MTRSPYNRRPGARSSGDGSDRQSRYSSRGQASRSDYPRVSRSGMPPSGGGGTRGGVTSGGGVTRGGDVN